MQVVKRAIAKTLVFDTKEVIKLLRKHGINVSQNVSYKELLDLVSENSVSSNFLRDFTNLMLIRKRITDYNGLHRNVIGAAIIGGLTSVVGGIFGASQQKKAKELAEEQMKAAHNQSVMAMMMQEEANKLALVKQDNMLVIAAASAMVVVTGLIIFTRSK